jgi:hypothetical protein
VAVLACAACGAGGSGIDEDATGPADVAADGEAADVVPEGVGDEATGIPEDATDASDGDADPAVETETGETIPEVAEEAAPEVETADVSDDPDAEPEVPVEVLPELPIDLPPEANPAPAIAVNEVVAATTMKTPDWVELYNHGDTEADLAGWTLKDNNDAHVFVFPAGTVMAAGGFLVIDGEGATSPLTLTFGFGKIDSVRIYDAAGTLVDQTSWVDGQAPVDMSWGRYPDGTGAFQTLTQPTRGEPNAAP